MGYYGSHARVKSVFGSASQYFCVECRAGADEWAYDGTDLTQLTQHVRVNGSLYPVTYSVWPEFYMPMCTSCHRAKDKAAWSERRTHCGKGHEFTPENIYVAPSKPGSKECRRCRADNSRVRYMAKKLDLTWNGIA